MAKKSQLILFSIVLIGVALVALILYQWSVLVAKKIALSSLQSSYSAVETELLSARETLAEVSSPDYHELYARKSGYGVEGEIIFISKNFGE